ncbi:uncharacterized protein PRCAT00001025001 [Priceomyces carsonii]|uniref:uncharacterized protein n=1 Tax=Priceomyces carsonii TaxID=28549 RepID=UPI002ED99486|nr:unnamed protein product [Priceomyces carsonii]
MLSLELGTIDLAVNYAFALAVRQDFIECERKLDNKLKNDAEADVTKKMQYHDLISNIRLLVTVLFPKILQYYREEHSKVKTSDADSLLFNFKSCFLEPSLTTFSGSNTPSTNDMIKQIESEEDGNTRSWYSTIRTKEEEDLGIKFYLILSNTLNVKYRLQTSSSIERSSEILSPCSGQYVTGIFSKFASFFDLSDDLTKRMESINKEIFGLLTEQSISIEQSYEYFKENLLLHMELLNSGPRSENSATLVRKLREEGNNLMSNLAFAQAIKVYTNALDIASYVALDHILQLLTNRAVAFISLNCFPEAISDLNQAIYFDRTFTAAWTQLGYCHLYMGTSLVALKCYLIALKTATGQILPHMLSNDDAAIQGYRDMKNKCILPQFVQKLTQAIQLTERRANQQRESSSEILKVINEVRRILASLRSRASEDIRQYFTYSQNEGTSSFRSVASRTNRARPNILSQDVAQNMLANNGMETVTVATAARNPLERIETDLGNPNARTDRPNTRDQQLPTEAGASDGVRGLFNDFGDLFEGRIEIQGEPIFPANAQPNTISGHGSTENDTNNQSNARSNENPVRDVLRGILPSVGNIFSQAMGGSGHSSNINHNQDSNLNETNQQSEANTSRERSHERTSHRTTNSTAARPDDDIDMPEVPDLD